MAMKYYHRASLNNYIILQSKNWSVELQAKSVCSLGLI